MCQRRAYGRAREAPVVSLRRLRAHSLQTERRGRPGWRMRCHRSFPAVRARNREREAGLSVDAHLYRAQGRKGTVQSRLARKDSGLDKNGPGAEIMDIICEYHCSQHGPVAHCPLEELDSASRSRRQKPEERVAAETFPFPRGRSRRRAGKERARRLQSERCEAEQQ
eukprot:scaffold77121_cov27-Tisochrysis_lutea.AAC.3